jgi:integrase
MWFTEHPEHEHLGEDLPLFVGTKVGRATARLRSTCSTTASRCDTARSTLAQGDPLRVYDLRHFHASTLLDAGMTIKDVRERLGHATPTMTLNRYWHSRTDDEARRQCRAAVGVALGRTPENVTPIDNKRSVG